MGFKAVAWICKNPQPMLGRDGLTGHKELCRNCGGNPIALHPVAICVACKHRVDLHGADKHGCGVTGGGEVCLCTNTFERPQALAE